MNEQTELKIGIGTLDRERVALKPAKVKIVGVKIEETAKAKKVSFIVKHPDKEEPIKLSSVSYIMEKEVVTSGTWFNLDKEGKLQRDSATAILLRKIGALTIEDAVGKDCETELEGKYLCFKAY